MSALLFSLSALAQNVDSPTDLQVALVAACESFQPVATLRLPGELALDPTELVVYPPPGCTNGSPPDLVFEPQPGVTPARVRLVGGADTGVYTLFEVTGVSLTLRDVSLQGPLAGDPGTTLTEPLSPGCAEDGGRVSGVHLDGTPPGLQRLLLDGVSAFCLDGGGGAVARVDSADLEVSGGTFTHNSANVGGVFQAAPGTGGSVIVQNATFEDNDANYGGALDVQGGATDVWLRGNTYSGNRALFGADLYTTAASLFMDYEEHLGGGANAVYVATSGDATIQRTLFCGGGGAKGGGVFAAEVNTLAIENNVFIENETSEGGGALYVEQSDAVSVRHNTFVANASTGTLGGGAALFADSVIELRNNIFAATTAGSAVTGTGAGAGHKSVHNLWFDNVGGDRTGTLAGATTTGDQVGIDPELAWFPNFCSISGVRPSPTSPVIDAGAGPLQQGIPGPCQDWADTDIPTDGENNGPVSGDVACDIGAHGGMLALEAADRDLDGFREIFDCDEADPLINPGAAEDCDFLDNDCNGLVDDTITTDWWPDNDGDGYGRAGSTAVSSCDVVPGHTTSQTDCDDADPLISPAAAEVCDGLDNDCNTSIDDGLQVAWVPDADGDGRGDISATPILACAEPLGNGPFVQDATDCDDSDPSVSPDLPEMCATVGVDDDCDGLVDELDGSTADAGYAYPDEDGDGVGTAAGIELLCLPLLPDGYVTETGDCDDQDPSTTECRVDEPDPEPVDGGCGCDSGAPGTPVLGGLGLLALLVRRRR